MEISRRALVGVGLGSVGAVLSGCGVADPLPKSLEAVTKGAAGQPSRGGVLFFGLSTDPANFDPHVSTGSASDYLRQLTYNGLLQFDDDGEVTGDLATEFGWADPTTYRVRIREGVTFHDGSTMTADDVVFSFQRMLDPDTTASSAVVLGQLDRVVASSRDTVEFHLKVSDQAFPFALALPTTNIVSRKWITSGADTRTSVMGTGPFTFVERVPGVSITFRRFDNYFEPELPRLGGIVFQPMSDDYARVTALRTATVDMIDYVPSTHVDVISKNPRLTFASDQTFGFGFVGFDMGQAPFDDVLVRRALALSIDRNSALETAFLGHGAAITGGLMPTEFAPYASELEGTMTYDPDQARSLLRQAGHEDLAFPMVTTSSYSVISRPAQAILPSMRSAGFQPQLTQQEWLTFRSSVSTRAFPVHAWGTAPKFGDPASMSDFLGSTGSFAKNFQFKDDTIDGLLARARHERQVQSRMEMYLEVEKRALELVPLTYTVRRVQGEAHYDYVKGYAHPPKGAWTAISLRRVWLEDRK